MNDARQKQLAKVAAGFTRPNSWVSIAALLLDWAFYGVAVTVAVLATPIWIKVLAAVAAGTATSMLFILGHDAAHRNLVSGKKLNGALARLVFFPCLHNYTLWVIQHNRLHHQSTNVRGLNSYSPLSVEEFSKATFGRRWLERIYRTPLGFGIYYFVERWWKDKFFPRAKTPPRARVRAWADFSMLCMWVALLVLAIVRINAMFGGSDPIWAVVWGFVVPFCVWNQLMGTTAFLQHTHPLVPWFRTQEEARESRSQAELTVLVQYPAWYDVLSHNIMQHQAHHVSARIPWFRLKSAQLSLTPLLGPDVVVERMGLRYLMRLIGECHLYDYASNRWVPFTARARQKKIRRVVRAGLHDFAYDEDLSLSHFDK